MRYALIVAGGSGTRLWPMSRQQRPKQLIPFINGMSLLRIADERLEGLVEARHRLICAGQDHHDPIREAIPNFDDARFIGEPTGRDTLNAMGLGAFIISLQDPEAVIGVFTADHIIEPVDRFIETVGRGYELAEANPNILVTFGITPTHAATGYGYLQLGEAIDGHHARVVEQFKEKPIAETAQQYHRDGPDKYLWNSGMFVWRTSTLLNCIKKYKPANYEGLTRIAEAWNTDQRDAVLAEVYPTLEKISIDFAIMEPASTDPDIQVAAVPMPVVWLDVGSWPAFAQTCEKDNRGNTVSAARHTELDTNNTLVASSEPGHLIATVGCDDLLIIHTPDATLVCRADRAEDIKQIHKQVQQSFGDAYL